MNKDFEALCENDDLSTNVRAIQLLMSKHTNNIKNLDDKKKQDRERRAKEREQRRTKVEAEKKAKKEAEEKAKRDAENILKIEASIILSLSAGGLPEDEGSSNVRSETKFNRCEP